ncbi:toprim domain-containing protein (plasmid) [Roseivivax marinus]|uniref:DUF7146 domain-containing protein n=1 Tax=Roseivivax marinus TaxID=1379903 RepID=UPI001F03F858|nr:toprim domain-containing protein [Roseivivax marinus]UMA67282.1 toprim domain-containing protein [Roseivivax marinus]
MNAHHPDITRELVREELTRRAEEVFEAAFGQPQRRTGKEWRPKANPSLAMAMRGAKRGRWHDHADPDAKGDTLDAFALGFCGLSKARDDFPRVLTEAARWCGIDTTKPADLSGIETRRKERETKAKDDEAQERAENARKVQAVQAMARQVQGTPAEAYLARRGISELPPSGLSFAEPLGYVKGFMHGAHAALVAWATDDAGNILGGQRILVLPDGTRPDVDERKPSFGAIHGAPFRIPARIEGGPICVAEGPESALSIWQATGFETWAVFGVSSWAAAPLPTGRKVVLCPDRDAHKSPAEKAFRKAVGEHLRAGRNIWVATAPEPEGSRADLNDTHQRAGIDAVREAISLAVPCHPHTPPPSGDREKQIAHVGEAVRGWAGRSDLACRAARAVARLNAERLPSDNAERKTIRQEVKRAFGLDYLPRSGWTKTHAGERVMVSGGQGIGKTAELVGRGDQPGALHRGRGYVTAFYSSSHPKSAENFEQYNRGAPQGADYPIAIHVRGMGATRPDDPEKTMCAFSGATTEAAQRGVSIPETFCRNCPLSSECAQSGYLRQQDDIKAAADDPRGAVLFLVHEHATLRLPGGVTPMRHAFDEEPRDRFQRRAAIPLERWGEDLRQFLAWTDHAPEAMADALGDLLSLINPLRNALRRAVADDPANGLAIVETKGRELAQDGETPADTWRRAAKRLIAFQDERLAAEISAEMGGINLNKGRAATLESRLESALERIQEGPARQLAEIFKSVARDVENGHGPRLTAVHRAPMDRRGDCIVAEYLAETTIPDHAPLIYLDGTANPVLARAHFGPDLTHQHFPIERIADATFLTGHSFSTSSFTGVRGDTGEPYYPERAERLRAKVSSGIATRPDAAVVAAKAALPLIVKDKRPTGHFNAIRGMNFAASSPQIITLGQVVPKVWALENIARAYAAALGVPFNPLGEHQMPNRTEAIRMRDGSRHPVEVRYHPDPTAQAVLRQIRDAEVTQAIDRVRGHFTHKHIVYGGAAVPDVTFDRVENFEDWCKGGTALARAAAQAAVVPLAPSEALRAFPAIWKNRDAIKRDEQYQKLRSELAGKSLGGADGIKYILNTVCPPQRSAVLCAYRPEAKEGRGGHRQDLFALVLTSPGDARAALEAALGPICVFRIESWNDAAIEADERAEREAIQAESAEPLKEQTETEPVPWPEAETPGVARLPSREEREGFSSVNGGLGRTGTDPPAPFSKGG